MKQEYYFPNFVLRIINDILTSTQVNFGALITVKLWLVLIFCRNSCMTQIYNLNLSEIMHDLLASLNDQQAESYLGNLAHL